MEKIVASLVRIGRRQSGYLLIAVAVYFALWATQQAAPDVLVVFFYSMILPLLAFPPMGMLCFLYEKRRIPYNWIVFLLLLLTFSAIAVTASTALLMAVLGEHVRHSAGNPKLTFSQFLLTGWKIPLVATLIVGTALEAYRRATCRVASRNRELEQVVTAQQAKHESELLELQRAREIQQSLLPMEIPQIEGFEVAAIWEPAEVVGGDYFDVLRLAEKKLAICIADVVGKSISAALLMANVQATVRAYASNTTTPAQLCSRVNSVLCANTADDKFVTLFYGVLDGERKTLQYCSAGHLAPALLRHSGETERLVNGGALLGVFPDWQYDDSLLQLGPGDRLLLFTDGITEAMSKTGEEFGEDRLIKAGLDDSCASKIKDRLLARVKRFCNSKLHDDATLIVVDAEPVGRLSANHPSRTDEFAGLLASNRRP